MKITRRRFIKNLFRGTLSFLGLTGGGYYYARYIEPELLIIKEYTIEHTRIPFSDLKIIQFSDTHIGFHYDLEDLKGLIEKMNNQHPDLILFTGDLVDKPHTYTFTPDLPELLQQLEAPLGKYWIYGNHDHGGYGTEKIKKVMSQGGFQLLQNRSIEIGKDNGMINLAGMDDVMLGKPSIEKTLENIDERLYTILMVHEPDIADQIEHYPVDLQLSGHSHGGQIQLPFHGYVVTPPLANKYVEGSYQFGSGLHLYVSRGTGTTRLPYRFLCPPEITVFHLKQPSAL